MAAAAELQSAEVGDYHCDPWYWEGAGHLGRTAEHTGDFPSMGYDD